MMRFGVDMRDLENELIAAGAAMAEFPLVKT
jgi:hypothetical protein